MGKKVLVIGSGGREHAIVDALSRSPQVEKIYCAPGNAGIALQAECVAIKDTDVDGLKTFAVENGIDLTVVGPEASLAVGVVDEKDLITGANIKPGDVLVGMASSGVHSNGFSLVRKVFSMTEESLNRKYEALGCSLGEALLAPTKIYVKALRTIKEAGVTIKACSHITGGGFYENIPRMLKDGTHAVVKKDSYPIPPIFKMLAVDGDIEEQMMYNTFNMGLGMVLAVDEKDVEATLAAIKEAGEDGYVVGHIEAGDKGVTLC